MLYVTGDVHGEHRWNKRCLQNVDKLTDEDILFVCGDFGHIFHGNKLEESHLNGMEKYKFTIAFVDGNHENFDLIYTYPKEIWQGGYVHRIKKTWCIYAEARCLKLQENAFSVWVAVTPETKHYARKV